MAAGAVISAIQPNSKAARAGLAPGDRLVRVNGGVVRDLIDLSFALSEEKVDLEVVKASGETVQIRIKKRLDESIGFEFESAVFDKVRTCANKCLFCFVDQMPAGLRDTLYVKDDDYRLSFLYGNFVTLTNLTQVDFDRIRKFHLSPLYVSVHTTDGELRQQLLGLPKAAEIMRQLQDFVEAGIEMHTQVVLCPGYNDGEKLTRTIRELAALGPEVLSLAIVPVGLTRFREFCHPLRTFTPAEAGAIVDEIIGWQTKFRAESGSSFVYLSDEFYLRAGREVPAEEIYDGYPQLENGIGLVRNFISEWEAAGGLPQLPAVSRGSEAESVVISGTAFAPILADLLKPLSPNVRVEAVVNEFFGQDVNVSGLLTGRDIAAHVHSLEIRPLRVVLSSTMLRKNEQVFLDGMTLDELQQELSTQVSIVSGARELHQLLLDGGI
jgi:putative radical SAM enzyme (TIGR03279 family)